MKKNEPTKMPTVGICNIVMRAMQHAFDTGDGVSADKLQP